MATSQRTLLDRAARYVRLPGSPDDTPEITESGDALRCPRTGDVYPLRDGVIDLLGEIGRLEHPADRILSRYFRNRRYIGAKDRRAVTDLFFRIIRKRAKLGWQLEQARCETAPRALAH